MVFQRFLSKITDQDLINLPQPTLESIEIGYLNSACDKFTRCKNDLSQRDDTTMTFNIDLTGFEIEILSKMMQREWVEPKISSIMLMKQHLSDGDFKTYSQSQHLRELQNLRTEIQEEIDRLIVQYTFDFGTWDNLG